MRMEPQPCEVREIVLRIFEDLGLAPGELADVDETIMLDEGRYVARSYRTEQYMAMWLISVGIVQFYDADGNMLCTVNLFEEYEPKRMAA